jgi:hypothetical protein
MITGISCATCVFFSPPPPYAKNQSVGQCRRHAPQLTEGERGIQTIWPLVGDSQWCGDHATPEGDEE